MASSAAHIGAEVLVFLDTVVDAILIGCEFELIGVLLSRVVVFTAFQEMVERLAVLGSLRFGRQLLLSGFGLAQLQLFDTRCICYTLFC